MYRRRGLRAAFVLVVVLATSVGGALAWPGMASAHSVLESTSPSADETVPTAPDQVVLRFNEPVQAARGAVRLLDAEGADVEIGQPKAVDSTVTATLPRTLPNGSYIVAWKVTSADSHPVTGAFTFAVGAPSVATGRSDVLAATQAQATSAGAQVAVDVTSALAYGGALLAIGVALFITFVAPPDPVPASVRRLVPLGASVGLVGLVTGIVAAAALVDGSWPSGSAFGDELVGSPGLQALIGAVGLAVAVASLHVVSWPAGARRLLVVDAAVFALGAFVIVGHTRTATPIVVTTVVDVVHLAAAAIWTGGLAALLLTLRRSGPAVATAGLVARFSSMATIAIVTVAVAGSVLGWQILGSWGALTGTTYGVLLLVKVGLFAVLAALGGYNRFRLVARVGGADPDASWALLRRMLSVEVLVVIAIIGVTGSFTSLSPEETPAGPVTTPVSCTDAAAMAGMPGMENMDHGNCVGTTTSSRVPFDPTAGAGNGGAAVTESAPFGGGLARISVSPATVGPNTVSIILTGADGAPLDPAEAPTVAFRLRTRDVGPIIETAKRVGPGAYRVRQDFVLPGEWEANVSAVVSDFDQPQAIMKFNVTG